MQKTFPLSGINTLISNYILFQEINKSCLFPGKKYTAMPANVYTAWCLTHRIHSEDFGKTQSQERDFTNYLCRHHSCHLSFGYMSVTNNLAINFNISPKQRNGSYCSCVLSVWARPTPQGSPHGCSWKESLFAPVESALREECLRLGYPAQAPQGAHCTPNKASRAMCSTAGTLPKHTVGAKVYKGDWDHAHPQECNLPIGKTCLFIKNQI